jgi:hypothetical protein
MQPNSPEALESAIHAKLQAHRPVITKAVHGSISWRRQQNGSWHIELKTTL